MAVVKYRSGAFGVIQGTTSVYPEQATRFEIHGEKGTVILADTGILTWKTTKGDSTELYIGASGAGPTFADGHSILVEDMIRAIWEDRDPMIPGEEARKAVDLILAIYESSREGKEVFLR